MWILNFKLIKKEKLTSDVFELTFENKEELEQKPGQFITFLLPKIWWRAYSILENNKNNIKLIIKRLENWRWWSKFICDSEIWDILNWVWPAGHFILQENHKNKLFLWTWTWFVPLYNQIISSIQKKLDIKLKLIFWVRNFSDLFYIKELENLKKENKNFDFELFLSREKIDWINLGYITDFLVKENTENFEEFYICWMPDMIDSSIEKLKYLWILDENIFIEKY